MSSVASRRPNPGVHGFALIAVFTERRLSGVRIRVLRPRRRPPGAACRCQNSATPDDHLRGQESGADRPWEPFIRSKDARGHSNALPEKETGRLVIGSNQCFRRPVRSRERGMLNRKTRHLRRHGGRERARTVSELRPRKRELCPRHRPTTDLTHGRLVKGPQRDPVSSLTKLLGPCKSCHLGGIGSLLGAPYPWDTFRAQPAHSVVQREGMDGPVSIPGALSSPEGLQRRFWPRPAVRRGPRSVTGNAARSVLSTHLASRRSPVASPPFAVLNGTERSSFLRRAAAAFAAGLPASRAEFRLRRVFRALPGRSRVLNLPSASRRNGFTAIANGRSFNPDMTLRETPAAREPSAG